MAFSFVSLRKALAVITALVAACIGYRCFGAEDKVISFAEARRITISHPMPGYPAGARSGRMKGQGVFVMCVSPKTGEVEKVEVYRSTGFRALDIEAIRALRRWRFAPGLPYSRIRLPIDFAGW
jgi:TonB family protein